MENTDIVLLKSGISSDVNILKPEEQEDILGGATKCDQGYRHGLFYISLETALHMQIY